MTVSNVSGSNSTFEANGSVYQLFVSGFDLPSGNQFLTEEGSTNTATLRAQVSVTAPPAVIPLPGALPLMILGVGLFGGVARAKAKAKARA